jgi:hypothetical protein
MKLKSKDILATDKGKDCIFRSTLTSISRY